MTERKKALKSDWGRYEAMPKEHTVLTFHLEFTLEEYEKLQFGFIPKQMEDKWFIYFEDKKLYFHRSWTEFCVYIVEFEVGEDSTQIIKVTANRNKNQYSEKDDRWDFDFVVYLINLLLLNKPTPYPKKKGVDRDTAILQQWSQVGKAMLEGEE